MKAAIPTATITRPATTTPFTAGDVCGSILQFDGMLALAGAGNGSLIESAVLIDGAYVAAAPDLELWLFSATLADLDTDNAAFTPTAAQLATLLGVIPFPSTSFRIGNVTAGINGNQICEAKSIGIVVTTGTIYGVLIVRNAYVPVASEPFTVNLGVIR